MARVLDDQESSSIKSSTQKQFSIGSSNSEDNTTSGISSRNTSTSSSAMDEEGSYTSPSSTGARSVKSSTSSFCSCPYEIPGDCEVFGNFIFKFIQPEDESRVLEHMRESFYRDEPLNAITGYSEEKAKDMDAMVSACFSDGLSSIILHKESHRVVGARIVAIHRREDVGKAPMKLNSEEMNRIMPFLHELDEKAGIFDHYPGVDEYVELFMASVHPDFRGQGLAGEMYRGAIRLLQAKGFKLLKSCFTSPFTQKIGEKMGFRELTRARFKDYRGPDGELVFPQAKDHEIATIGVLEI